MINYNEFSFSEIDFIKKGKDMFIGREKELKLIDDALGKDSASVMVYGKRKVGKTTLISHALKNHKDKYIYYECLRSSLRDNIDGFVSVLVRAGVLPVKMNFDSFIDVFAYLNSLPYTLNVVIDEYPYLKAFADAKTVDSIFQNIIDNRLSNIRLFVSGSHIGMMKDLLEEGNALYGRFDTVIRLKELDYKTASAFYPDKSVYDKVAFYSVFGGSPFINESVNPELSLKENIVNTVLNPSSAVFHYTDNLLLSDLSVSSNLERIFHAIANGRKRYTEIQNKLSMNGNGLLSKQLNILTDMDLVSKENPINKQSDSKKARYEITDNLLRFYYTYVYGNRSALQVLGADAFYDEYIEPSITTFISHRFEDICRTYFSMQVQSGNMKGILNIGSYYYDDAKTRTNGEFDVALLRNDCVDIYEVKYLSSPLTVKQMLDEMEQVHSIKGVTVGKTGFISVNGFEENSLDCHCIDGNELYK